MGLPKDYYTAPRKLAERNRKLIILLKELEDITLNMRYVFGGAGYFHGSYFFLTKVESDTIEPEDHNTLVSFALKYLEFIKTLLGVGE